MKRDTNVRIKSKPRTGWDIFSFTMLRRLWEHQVITKSDTWDLHARCAKSCSLNTLTGRAFEIVPLTPYLAQMTWFLLHYRLYLHILHKTTHVMILCTMLARVHLMETTQYDICACASDLACLMFRITLCIDFYHGTYESTPLSLCNLSAWSTGLGS